MIESERLHMRAIENRDLEPLREMRNDDSTRQWLTFNGLITKEQQEAWFERLGQDDSRLYLAVESKEGELVGVLRSDEWDRDNRSVRVGSDIHPDHRGQGYATEALGSFVNYLFTEEEMHRVWLLVVDKNEPAKRVYEKLGFQTEGVQRDAIHRDGEYHDYISMSILENEWTWPKEN